MSKAESRLSTDKKPQDPAIDVNALFQGQREIRLHYRGETYRLRITRNDKLILTK
ncbi:MAG: hemin uptake protein HemP [Pseudomonadota bacterium]